jgi:hypothetical protein
MECEDRRVDRAALEVVSDMVRDPKVFAMVILPRRGFRSRIQRLLHDRTADSIATAVVNVPRTAATIVPYRMAPIHREHVTPDAADTLSDSVTRGGVREETHFEADDKLEARANEIGAVDIGTLKLRENAQIAGRVKSVTVERAESGQTFTCQIADASGSIKLVFQGRSAIPGVERGVRLLIKGTVTSFHREAVILNPEYEIVGGVGGDEE